ncbi:MAG: RteC domain-containing protein [Bacteroidota bacterium]
MFNKFYDALYVQLTDSLAAVNAGFTDPVKRFAAAMQEIQGVLTTLREKVLSVPFPTEEIEIGFFKEVKPRFLALKIFYFELYGLDMNRPKGVKEELIDWYQDELGVLKRFFSLHAGLYEYFRTGRMEMDRWYFLRGQQVPCAWIEVPTADPLYASQMDYLWGKFIAYELLAEEILRRIGLLDGSLVVPAAEPVAPLGIKWTGKIVNLGELIYGLYYTGQLNHGNAQLSEIVALFERMFLVKIRDVHHTFGEIRERKVTSPSKFLDSMAAAIRDRVDEDLKYKPG